MPGTLPTAEVRAWNRAEVPVPASKPRKAPVPVVRAQNMPSRKVANSGRIHEAEHQLNNVHRIGPVADEVGAHDTQQDAHDRNRAAHPHVVIVALVWRDIGLVKVVGPDRVKGGDVAGHA